MKHGLTNHSIFRRWQSMVNRCTRQEMKCYKDYGGRGIKVCDKWLDVRNFVKDMYPTFKEGLQLDRIDNNGNYEPANCRWVTKSQNQKNRRCKAKYQSDIAGVYYRKETNKWFIRHPVSFDRKEDAESIALKMRQICQ